MPLALDRVEYLRCILPSTPQACVTFVAGDRKNLLRLRVLAAPCNHAAHYEIGNDLGNERLL
jgi:hypothetical protein